MSMKIRRTGQPGDTRRSFIKAAAATATAATADWLTPRGALAAASTSSHGRIIGANDRIAVAYVGTGAQGGVHIREQKKYAAKNNIVQAAVCDLYQRRLDKARETTGVTEANAVRDYRRVIDRKDIDAVVVSTVDNWHAPVAIDALESGKHVYGEKPMARYLNEGFRLHDTVKKTKKTYCIGSQFCTEPRYAQIAEWIRAGKLGPLVWAQGAYCRNNKDNSEWTYPIEPEANEQNLDWKTWLGKAPQLPFNPERFFSWHKFYAYNSGILGNLLPHIFLPLLLATTNNEFPRRVACTGTRKISTDREISDTTHLLAEMPSGLTFCVAGSTVNEQGLPMMIRGRKGTVYTADGRAEFKPERPFAELDSAEFTTPAGGYTSPVPVIEKNFFDCIRSGAAPVTNVDLAIRAHTILCMAEMSERMSLTLLFDDKTRKITTGDGRVIPAIDHSTVLPKMA